VSAAPAGAAAAWVAIIAAAAHVFTRPSLAIFTDLADGWVLTPGRRTITRIIQVVDAAGYRAHDAYHRFLRDGAWSMPALWRTLTVRIAGQLCEPDQPVVIDLDDTLLHKSGPRIEGAGIFRDAVRSTKKRVVHALGLNLVVITVRVSPPWGGMPVGLPINMRVRRKDDEHTTVELARQMLAELAGWLPDRRFQLACDGAYASLCGAGLERVQVTSRIRRNADVCELTPPRTGKRGRPRKKGDQLPKPPDLAEAATDWAEVTINQRGDLVDKLVWSRRLLWYNVAGTTPLLLVIIRDPDRRQPDDFLITTDTGADPSWVAEHYAGRWTIECVFREVKQHLGAEDPQCWKRRGPERAAALALWLHAAVWLWYIPTYGARRSWTPTPWYTRKDHASFADALAALRRTLWRNRITAMCSETQLPTKIIRPLIDTLAQAA
jgi:DDE superfamily endonuclease